MMFWYWNCKAFTTHPKWLGKRNERDLPRRKSDDQTSCSSGVPGGGLCGTADICSTIQNGTKGTSRNQGIQTRPGTGASRNLAAAARIWHASAARGREPIHSPQLESEGPEGSGAAVARDPS